MFADESKLLTNESSLDLNTEKQAVFGFPSSTFLSKFAIIDTLVLTPVAPLAGVLVDG